MRCRLSTRGRGVVETWVAGGLGVERAVMPQHVPGTTSSATEVFGTVRVVRSVFGGVMIPVDLRPLSRFQRGGDQGSISRKATDSRHPRARRSPYDGGRVVTRLNRPRPGITEEDEQFTEAGTGTRPQAAPVKDWP